MTDPPAREQPGAPRQPDTPPHPGPQPHQGPRLHPGPAPHQDAQLHPGPAPDQGAQPQLEVPPQPGAGDEVERDAGVAAERTGLAWRRTGLSASAVALLMARWAFEPGAGRTIFLMVAAGLFGWAMLVGVAYRRARGLRAWPPRAGQRTVSAYALVTVALAAIGAMLVML